MAGRPRSGNPRSVVIATRVTEAEKAEIDEWRGSLSEAAFLRLLIVMERRRRRNTPGPATHS